MLQRRQVDERRARRIGQHHLRAGAIADAGDHADGREAAIVGGADIGLARKARLNAQRIVLLAARIGGMIVEREVAEARLAAELGREQLLVGVLGAEIVRGGQTIVGAEARRVV
ncbi:hypothetical protein ACS48_00125 [Bacillus cereus]|nr:hypothetical protein ACS48_00125 [Bacillus cereus]